MKNLYILTDSKSPQLIKEDQPLLEELASLNIQGLPVVWDEFDPPANALILVRTPWDYSLKNNRFLALLDKIDQRGARLINSTETVRWNLNKEYLCQLLKRGAPVVKTSVFKNAHLSKLLAVASFPLVLKPLVGGAGRDTFLLKSASDLKKCAVLEGRDILAQPFIPSIQTEGEYSFMFFDGKFSHAVVKKAKAGEFRVQEEHGGTVEAYLPPQAQIQQARQCLEKSGREFVYARVDLVKGACDTSDSLDSGGRLLMMELEAIEPQLFFAWSDEALKLFASTLAGKVSAIQS